MLEAEVERLARERQALLGENGGAAMTKKKPAKPKKICQHDTPKNHGGDSIMFRCLCGNVWIGGKFQGAVPPEHSAVSIFGAFSRGPAVPR
jgi:hypothetical protein